MSLENSASLQEEDIKRLNAVKNQKWERNTQLDDGGVELGWGLMCNGSIEVEKGVDVGDWRMDV